jgi:hypothetical protein
MHGAWQKPISNKKGIPNLDLARSKILILYKS